MFESAVSVVLVVFLLIFVGFLCARRGWFGMGAATVLSRVTMRVGLPGLILSNILDNYTLELLRGSARYLLIPLATIGGLYALSGWVARLCRIPPHRRGIFRALMAFGNTVFVGMPVCRAIIGEAAVPLVLLYYFVNTSLWWLIGAPRVARDAGADSAGGLQRLASPPLITLLISLALLLLNLRPPEIIMDAARSLGAMVTPLSMLFIGVMLQSMLAEGIRWQRGYGIILLGRHLIGPVICLPLCLLMKVPPDMLVVFFLQAGMATQTQSCLLAQMHGGDAGYAAGGIVLSTAAGLVAIPLYTLLLGGLGLL